MVNERDRSHFNHSKSRQELGILFRPVEETLRDTVAWYQENGWLGRAVERKTAVKQPKPNARLSVDRRGQ